MLLISPAAGLAQEPPPELIVIEHENLFPEGIAYDESGERFLVSSMREGTIFAVDDAGMLTPFVEDDDLDSTLGLEIDADRERLLVTSVVLGTADDPAANLASYDLTTGERLYLADLLPVAPLGRHMANDVAVDAEGNAYVTDSYAPLIWEVDPDGEVSIFVYDQQLGDPFFGLNGIAYHPDGYLLAAMTTAGTLYKITLEDEPVVTRVDIANRLSGADGLWLRDPISLLVVSGLQGIFLVQSADDWEAATVTGLVMTDSPATTVTRRDDDFYVLYAHFSQFLAGRDAETFEIGRIVFE
jgi:sugar lactone lactonase YvrE